MSCAVGELLDGATCVPEDCGSGTWGSVSTDDTTVYVDAAATAGGDGSASAPLADVQAGLDLAGSRGGGLVALAAGTYGGPLELGHAHDGVALRGRCSALSVLDGGHADDVATLTIVSDRGRPAVALSGLTITGGAVGGLAAQGADVDLSDVSVVDNEVGGLVFLDATATLARVTVTGTTESGPKMPALGLDAESGASVTGSDCLFDANTGAGVRALEAGTAIALTDSEVRGTLPLADGTEGWGVYASEGASITLDGVVVDENTQAGVLADGAGTTITVDASTISGTLPDEAGIGWGAEAQAGASLTLRTSTIVGNTGVAVRADGDGTSLVVADCTLSDTLEGNGDGYGLNVLEGASASVSGSTLTRNLDAGILAIYDGTTVDLRSTVIEDTAPLADGTNGVGIQVGYGAALTATNCTVQRNVYMGVQVQGDAAVARLQDCTVADTAVDPEGWDGMGVAAFEGAAVQIEGGSVVRNHTNGVMAYGEGADVQLLDVTVADNLASDAGGGGFGLWAEGGASLSATGVEVRGNETGGTMTGDAGSRMDLTDVLVTGSTPNAARIGGYGATAKGTATLTITGSIFDGNTDAGVCVLDADTEVHIRSSIIRGTLSARDGHGDGVDVQDGGFVDISDSAILDNEGFGVDAFWGSTLTVTDSTISGSREFGVIADDAEVTLVGCTIANTSRASTIGFAPGVYAQAGSTLTATDLLVTGSEGPGLAALAGASVSCDGCTLDGNAYAGALVCSSSLSLTASTVTNTGSDAEYGGGFGVYASGLYGATSLDVSDSTLGPHPYAALWLDGDGDYDIQGNEIHGGPGVTAGASEIQGNAVFAEDGVSARTLGNGLGLRDNAFVDSPAIAVFLDESSATLRDNTWSGNTVDLQQQRCESTTPLARDDLESVPATVLCPEANTLTAYDVTFSTIYLPEVNTAE